VKTFSKQELYSMWYLEDFIILFLFKLFINIPTLTMFHEQQ
jgi:hypothetical protein